MSFKVGDKIVFREDLLFGGKRVLPQGIEKGKVYSIDGIDEGIDGAFDYDDLHLEGIEGTFCEFDFTEVPKPRCSTCGHGL